jgi:hypothetical protein
MVKKSKKKTVASTRKKIETEADRQESKKKERKPLFKKLFTKKEKIPAARAEKVEKIQKVEKKDLQKILDRHSEMQRLKTKKPRLLHRHKQTIKGGFLLLIGIFALAFIGSFLFGKFFRPQSIAELLPADETLAFAEINVDGADYQTLQFYDLLKRYPVYQPGNIIKLINYLMPINYTSDLEPWLGRRIGAAAIREGNKTDYVFFVETRDRNKTLEILKKQVTEKFNDELVTAARDGIDLYSYKFSHSLNFIFLNNYLVASANEQLLNMLIESYVKNTSKVSDDRDYQKVSNNLPHGGVVFAYVNLNKYYDAMGSDPAFVSQKGRYFSALKPFLGMFKAEGLSIFSEKDKFVAQTFTSINEQSSQTSGGSYITFDQKYQGKLLDIANEAPVFLAGGHDLTKELTRMEDIFKSGANASSMIFNGLLEAQKQKYFGNEISLKNDIYPLLKGEYLFSIDNSFEKPVINFVVELSDKIIDPDRVEKLIAAFVKAGGVFSSHLKTITLPDGTIGQEMVSEPEQITRSQEPYDGKDLITLKLGETKISILSAIIDGKFILSTDRNSITKIIDRISDKTLGLGGTENYSKNFKPLLTTADEIFNLKLGALTALLGLDQNEIISPYLIPFVDLTLANNYFTDGISTIYFIGVI